MKKLTIEICSDNRMIMIEMLKEIISQIGDYDEGLGKTYDSQYHFVIKELSCGTQHELFVRT